MCASIYNTYFKLVFLCAFVLFWLTLMSNRRESERYVCVLMQSLLLSTELFSLAIWTQMTNETGPAMLHAHRGIVYILYYN